MVEAHIGELKERLTRVEVRVEAHEQIFATQEGMRSVVEPIKEAVLRTDLAVQAMARTHEQAMKQLTESITSINAGHEQYVVEKNEREREEHQGRMAAQAAQIEALQKELSEAKKSRTLPGWVKDYGPVISLIIAVLTFLSVFAIYLHKSGAFNAAAGK